MTNEEFLELIHLALMGESRLRDINGLLGCPICGKVGEVRLQTPIEDDGMVLRAFFRCFKCMACSPPIPDWVPLYYHETGKVPFAPFRDFWNTWVESQGK